MRHTVIWVPKAEQESAALWMGAADKDAVTRAAHAIDVRLRDDPLAQGESRPSGRRILFEQPLAVIFEVIPDDCKVQVLTGWEIGKRP